MQKKEQVTILICDGCGAEYIERKDIEPTLGIRGKFFWHHAVGGGGGDFFACDLDCVKDAIHNATFPNPNQ